MKLEELENIIEKEMSGQESERNLVDAINEVVENNKGKPIMMNLGELGNHQVTGAKQLGGGKPEPKADIAIFTTTKKDGIGISMKKENFDFFGNWMGEKKLMDQMQDSGLDETAAKYLIAVMKDKLKEVSSAVRKSILQEKYAFTALMRLVNPKYTDIQPIGDNEDAIGALMLSPHFQGPAGPRSNMGVKNYYYSLKEILGDGYESFLRTAVRGSSKNPFQADGVLIANVPTNINTLSELQPILKKIITIESSIKSYAKDPDINIYFRLRPITKVRTAYSKTNRSKYGQRDTLYKQNEDTDNGIVWFAFVTKGKQAAEQKRREEERYQEVPSSLDNPDSWLYYWKKLARNARFRQFLGSGIFKENKLTNTKITYKMLEQMVEEAIKKAR